MPTLDRLSLPDSGSSSANFDHLSLSPISLPIRLDHPEGDSTSHDISLDLNHDQASTAATAGTLSLDLLLSQPDERRFAALAADYHLEIVHLSAPIFLAPGPSSVVARKDETAKKKKAAADGDDAEAKARGEAQ